MMTEKIKPCPYCGSPDAPYTINLYPWCVACTCGATGPAGNDVADAILLWNAAANALEAEQAKTRDVLDAYTTVIAARDEDERLYQDEITRLERQVATLEQQLQTELDMRNTHAVEEVEKYKAERDEAKKINETVYPEFLDLKEDVVELRDKNRCLESQLDYYKRSYHEVKAMCDEAHAILSTAEPAEVGERIVDNAKRISERTNRLQYERDEARKWAREYKRRLIQAAKAMRGDEG